MLQLSGWGSLMWTIFQTRMKNESSLKFSEAYRVNLSPSILPWLDITFSGSFTIMKTLVVFSFQICAFTLGIEGLVRSLWFPCFFLFIDKMEVKEGEGFLAVHTQLTSDTSTHTADNSSSRLTPKVHQLGLLAQCSHQIAIEIKQTSAAINL